MANDVFARKIAESHSTNYDYCDKKYTTAADLVDFSKAQFLNASRRRKRCTMFHVRHTLSSGLLSFNREHLHHPRWPIARCSLFFFARWQGCCRGDSPCKSMKFDHFMSLSS